MDKSPYNHAILRHMALNVIQKEGSKALCAANLTAPGGTMPVSANSWPHFEMQLP